MPIFIVIEIELVVCWLQDEFVYVFLQIEFFTIGSSSVMVRGPYSCLQPIGLDDDDDDDIWMMMISG